MTGNKTATTAIFRFITAVAVLVSAVTIYCIVAGKQNNAELRELVGEADARGAELRGRDHKQIYEGCHIPNSS